LLTGRLELRKPHGRAAWEVRVAVVVVLGVGREVRAAVRWDPVQIVLDRVDQPVAPHLRSVLIEENAVVGPVKHVQIGVMKWDCAV